jgi:hypothetical protein
MDIKQAARQIKGEKDELEIMLSDKTVIYAQHCTSTLDRIVVAAPPTPDSGNCLDTPVLARLTL